MQHERRRFQKARRLATIAALLLCAWMLQGSSTPMLSSLTGGVRMIDVLEAQGETELALGLLHAGSMFPDEEITDLVARERNLRKLRLLVHAGRHAEAYDFMRQAHDWFEGRDLPLLHAALALRTARPESALSALMPMPHLDDPLRSYAFLLRAQALRQTERWEEARQAVSQAHPASLPREFRRRLNLIDATCALQLQHTEGLAELASQLSADARHDDENGLLLARMVEVALARGDTVQGTEWALGLLEARPTPAETAYEMLLDLEGSGRWLPTAEQNILIAHYEMDNDHLLPSARRLLHTLETQSATMQPEQIGEAWVELARTRQMRNQHSRCLELLADKADLIRGTKAEAEMLRLLARSEKSRGNEAAAIDIYRDLARRFPGHPRADDALYEVGWRQEIRAQLSQAERTYGELPRMFPRSALADDATMRQGLCALRDDRYDDALGYFRQLVVRYPNSPLIARALYWRLWIQLRQGDSARALGLRERLNDDFPYSYFTFLANSGAADPLPSGHPQGDAPATGLLLAQRNHDIYMTAIQQLRAPTAGDLPKSFRQDSSLWSFLLDHGFLVEASWESRRLERRYHRNAAALLELLAGNYTRGEHSRLIRISYQLSLLLARPELSESIEVIRYPAPFSVGLSQTADDNKLSHAATLAIMRHESAFDTRVDSRAGARGLMQLMPGVGQSLARRMGREGFHIDDLYDAETNFTLGCRLFSEELRRAHWSLPQALAAYNAGSAPAARWASRLRPDDPPELYLDVAEYYETRSYLERVLGSTEVYRRLYDLP